MLEEKILVLSERLNPFQMCSRLHKSTVFLCHVVASVFVAHEDFFEVVVIKNVWVHGPACVRSFCCFRVETERAKATHKSHIV